MNFRKLSIAVLFLTTSGTLFYAQEKNDTVKKEKKIEGVIIQGTTKKGGEANIISVQRKSVEVIERVGSVQLEKQGVGDVSVAVTKATGSQKQEGSGQIFIRGLGDRNNSTTINGLQVPSNDPLYKNIDLSIIKTDMIDFIGLEKVYNPKLWGDMSGANVDIVTKVYTGKPYFKVNLGSSVNFNSVQKNNYFLQDGPNFFGSKILEKPSKNAVLNRGYVFTTSLKDQEINNPINSALSFDFGTNFKIGEQGKLSIFGYGGFDNSYDYFQGITGGSFDTTTGPNKIYDNSEEFKYSTNTTGLINVNYRINSKNNINFSSNYIHTTEQKLGNYSGYNRDYYDNDVSQERYVTQIRRATYKTNDLIVNQLKGEHTLSEPLKIIWNLGYNRLDSRRPDRQQNITVLDKLQNYSFFASSNPGANNRYYDRLLENDFVGDLHADYKLGENTKITLGYSGRYKDSDFKATQYNFRILPAQGTYYVDPKNYDSFFNIGNYQMGGFFDIVTFRGDVKYNPETAFVPQFFTSEIMNNAGYVNVDYKFSEKFTAQVGVRYDNLQQEIVYNTTLYPDGGKVNKDYSKILPAFNLKYSLNDKHNFRLAGSKTYTTPLLLEVAPFEYEDIDESTIGNPEAYPADNYNVDLKWEWFPKKNELISLTAFGKYIQNPISRIVIASASNIVSFMNIGDTGRVFGLEAEIRKDIYDSGKTRLYTFINGTYLNTEQDLDENKVRKENTKYNVTLNKGVTKDKLQGASEFLANANLGLEQKWGDKNTMDFVVSYSYISDNIYAIGTQEKGNLVDKAFSTLDATMKIKLGSGIGFSLTGRNLINPYFTRVQDNKAGELVSRKYKRGSGIGASVSYEF
ncbi:TonB-dependent receptor [Chryseobacterium wangxinyae]|uniref:TonB-dependent receptor domain-containing protein n=1 Tax=Chryseobacterium sp. CY350 TaxID=2997336 RepID=UPI002271E2C5|nr:TonB-dependent receptor [Chryseobacterium sp. CY350]MCY0978075.1 TonB-dependent receptor [Chryseobacterium sp. CY350]WBZ95162.1 TonB-dependent receptor [Chryseobacterium sp. CY350]